MGDRAFLLLVGAAALATSVAVAVGLGPLLADDSFTTTGGDVIRLAALAFGTLGALAGTAQVRRMYRTGSSRDVSRGFLAMLCGSFLAWLAYGVALEEIVMQVVNVLGFTVTGTTLAYAQRLHARSTD